MATIKLQPSGAVVLKDGKVACTCCCGCSAISIPASLRETLENATSATVWGYNSTDFYPNPSPEIIWAMEWFFPAPEGAPYNIFVEISLYNNGCLYFRGEYITLLVEDPDSFAAYGDPELCDFAPGETYATGNFSINGEGEFPYWYLVSEFTVPPPVPNIVFS